MPVSGFRVAGLLMVIALLLPWDAYAGPMTSVLCYILYDVLLTNGLRGFGTLAIAALGVAAMLGKASWGLTLTVISGIAVLYGSVQIVLAIGLGSAAAACS